MAQRPKDGYIIIAALTDWGIPPKGKGKPATQKQRTVAAIVDSINYGIATEYEDGKIVAGKYTADLTRLPYSARAYDPSVDVVAATKSLIDAVSALTGEKIEQTGNIDADLTTLSDRIGGHLLSENSFAKRMLNPCEDIPTPLKGDNLA